MTQYESLLLSLTYANTAPEPLPGSRSVTITLSDGLQLDMTAVIVIVILRNDNPLAIRVDTSNLTYSEGDTGLDVGVLSGVMLVDADREAMVERVVVRLEGAREEGNEQLVLDSSAVESGVGGGLVSGSEIELLQRSSLENYQVRDCT